MIVVDSNAGENPVHAGLLAQFGEAAVKRERLDIGDVRLVVPGGAILVERKTWSDFVSSLRDGRYANQKLRLLAERERAREAGERLDVVYLIEGNTVQRYEGKTAGTAHNQPYAALAKMTLRDGIFVLYSATAEDTARHVAYVYSAALKGGFDSQAHAEKVSASGYAGACKFTGKRKNAQDAGFQMMLATVHGCSGAKAAAVAERFPNAAALVRAYDALPSREAGLLLADVESGGKRLGPALSEKIRAAICG
jgi:hypothetical protein